MMHTTKESMNSGGAVARLASAGFSLLELVVVMMILVAVAVIVLPMISTQVRVADGAKQSPREVVTRSTMREVQEAMVGDDGMLENLSHEPNAIPRDIEAMVEEEAPEEVVQAAPNLQVYDPFYRIGWRGPYLFPTGQNDEGKPTVVDGWGRELEIQVDFNGDGMVSLQEMQHLRIVSAGENGRIDTPADQSNMKPGEDADSELTLSECGDDVVLFVSIPDSRRP